MSMPPRVRGIALVVVLWVLVLLTLVVGVYAVLTRTESLQARFLLDTTAARYAAEAGIHMAVFELRNPDLETRWVADGRPYQMPFGDAMLEIRIWDESGRVDLNRAEPDLLVELFILKGVEETEAMSLAAAIVDWRDPDDLVMPMGAEIDDYLAAGFPYGPTNQPFGSVDELQQVFGMSWELFRTVEDLLTVHSPGGQINPAFAPAEVLALLPDMDLESAELFVAERQQYDPNELDALMMPNGQLVSLRGQGQAFRIRSHATLDTEAWTAIEATVQLGMDQRGRPFRTLRWRERLEN